MPIYEYECSRHGVFEATRPMSEYRAPQPCPACGAAAVRAIVSTPALARVPHAARVAHQRNERSAHEPASSKQRQHGKGCSCCSSSVGKSATRKASDGSKTFPSKRPWMISH